MVPLPSVAAVERRAPILAAVAAAAVGAQAPAQEVCQGVVRADGACR